MYIYVLFCFYKMRCNVIVLSCVGSFLLSSAGLYGEQWTTTHNSNRNRKLTEPDFESAHT